MNVQLILHTDVKKEDITAFIIEGGKLSDKWKCNESWNISESRNDK